MQSPSYKKYHEFANNWKQRLADDENIYSVINVYSALKHLKEFWNSSTKRKGIVDLRVFEKKLVTALIDIVHKKRPDFSLIEKLDKTLADLLRFEIVLLSGLGLNNNSIRIIDDVLSLCHQEDFIKDVFNRIFNSSEEDSTYLTSCILRILVEKHSRDFLVGLPIHAFVRYVLNRYSQDIFPALNKDFENHQQIFDSLHQFAHEKLFPVMENVDRFKEQSTSGKYSNQLKINLEHVVNYLREQLKYNISTLVRENGKIVLNGNFENIARRTEKYFYHQCITYLIIRIDIFRKEMYSYLLKFLSENNPLQFNNFSSLYNDKVGLTYDNYSIKSFSADVLSKIFVNMLIIISNFCPFDIPDFSTRLKSVMDNFSDISMKDLIQYSPFIKNLRDFFFTEFDNNFLQLVEIVKNINFDKMSQHQRKNIAIHMFLKDLPERIEKNHEQFKRTQSDIENIDEYYCSLLFYGKKKYRVFLPLKGIQTDESLIDLGEVKIYNDKWNFQESISFLEMFQQNTEPMDKFKFKVCCDIQVNNEHDALITAKQKGQDALSRITFTYFSARKTRPPFFDTYHDITEIPPILGEMAGKVLWPIEVVRELLDSLKDLGTKSTSSKFLQRSLTWFKEGYYSITEYSEFLYYWLGLETILGIVGNINTRAAISITLFVNALANKDPDSLHKFIQAIGLANEIKVGSTAVSILKVIFENHTNQIDDINTELLDFIDQSHGKLDYVFLKLFTLYYIYAKRNSLVHEGETFSFELGSLSRVLERYTGEMIKLFKDY